MERDRLAQAVLAGRGVEDEERLRLRPGQPPVDHPPDLCQLVHQVDLGVEPPGGVGDHDVGPTCDRRHRWRRRPPRPGPPRAHGRRCRRPPASAQIPSCSDAAARKVSAAARMTRRPRLPLPGGELADRGRLAGAVDARRPARRAWRSPRRDRRGGDPSRGLAGRGSPRARERTAAAGDGESRRDSRAARRPRTASTTPTSPAMSASSAPSQSASPNRRSAEEATQPGHEAAAAAAPGPPRGRLASAAPALIRVAHWPDAERRPGGDREPGRARVPRAPSPPPDGG